jgi:nucleoid-associated protein YgaU
MGCVQQAVLEFDEEVRAPWRPRLVADESLTATAPVVVLRSPSRHAPSRVGACRPPVAPAPSDAPAPAGRPAGARTPCARPAVRGSGRRPASARPGAPRPGAVRLRLTRRARRLAVVLALAVGVAVGSWLAPLLSGSDGDLRLAGVESVVVQPGDTLWSIAGSLGGDDDVRTVVDRIQELNGLDGAPLVPGQILRLP